MVPYNSGMGGKRPSVGFVALEKEEEEEDDDDKDLQLKLCLEVASPVCLPHRRIGTKTRWPLLPDLLKIRVDVGVNDGIIVVGEVLPGR